MNNKLDQVTKLMGYELGGNKFITMAILEQ